MEHGRDDYWSALARGDRAGALDAVKRMQATGLSHLQVIEQVIVPAQERLGELWLTGGWNLAQEQAATAINEGLVHWLCSFEDVPAAAGPAVLVACLDAHEVPALVVSEQLSAAGVPTTFLPGADPAALVTAVVRGRPRAVLLSATLTSSLAGLKPLLRQLGATGIPVVVGGRAFGGDAARATALGATAYAATVDEVLELLAELPTRLPPREPEVPSPAELEAAWLAEYDHEIVPYVVRALAARHPGVPGPAWWSEVEAQLHHVLGCLAASLVTGDETIMIEVREWLAQVLTARHAPAGLVEQVWEVLAAPLRGHPLARVHLAGSAPVAGLGDGGKTDGLAAPA